jgi:hypothetical protein
VFAALALAVVAIAGPGGNHGDRVLHGTLDSGGLTRTYRLFAPGRTQPRPALVVVLHGGFGTGDGAARQTGFDDEAARQASSSPTRTGSAVPGTRSRVAGPPSDGRSTTSASSSA